MKNKLEAKTPLVKRFDKLVEAAGVRMSRIPRRSFLGRLTSGIIVVGGSSLMLKPRKAQGAVCGITECYDIINVNVCYYPYIVTAPEPGRTDGVVMRKGPSFSAGTVRDSNNNPRVIQVGKHFGRISNRNGGSTCDYPGMRQNNNGFIWGNDQSWGWIPMNPSGAWYSQPDPGSASHECAAYDWDCRYAGTDAQKRLQCPAYLGCGFAGASNPTTCGVTYHTVRDPSLVPGGTLGHCKESYFMRFASNSTAVFWLYPGDKVKSHGYKTASQNCGSSYNGKWNCIEAVCCKYVPYGCRGWTQNDILSAPISVPAGCGASVTGMNCASAWPQPASEGLTYP